MELFTERGGTWYRLGEHLPAFGVPFRPGDDGAGLDRLLIPGRLSAQRASGQFADPLWVGMVPEAGQRGRPATALRCSLAAISVWAEEATSRELCRLRAAWRQGAAGSLAEAEVFVLGEPGELPHLAESMRYWGTDLLVPLGFRADPDLPAEAIRGAVGAGAEDLVVIDAAGIELVDREAFEPLSRAGIRLAFAGLPGNQSPGGRER